MEHLDARVVRHFGKLFNLQFFLFLLGWAIILEILDNVLQKMSLLSFSGKNDVDWLILLISTRPIIRVLWSLHKLEVELTTIVIVKLRLGLHHFIAY